MGMDLVLKTGSNEKTFSSEQSLRREFAIRGTIISVNAKSSGMQEL
jgi:hypothetical protein